MFFDSGGAPIFCVCARAPLATSASGIAHAAVSATRNETIPSQCEREAKNPSMVRPPVPVLRRQTLSLVLRGEACPERHEEMTVCPAATPLRPSQALAH